MHSGSAALLSVSAAKSRHSRPCSGSGGEPHFECQCPSPGCQAADGCGWLRMPGQFPHFFRGDRKFPYLNPLGSFDGRLILSVGGVIIHPTPREYGCELWHGWQADGWMGTEVSGLAKEEVGKRRDGRDGVLAAACWDRKRRTHSYSNNNNNK